MAQAKPMGAAYCLAQGTGLTVPMAQWPAPGSMLRGRDMGLGGGAMGAGTAQGVGLGLRGREQPVYSRGDAGAGQDLGLHGIQPVALTHAKLDFHSVV